MSTQELLDFDRKYLPKVIAGTDEAGRGPLAGPVVAAAVIMPLKNLIDGINDSKKLSENKRERLYEQIIREAVAYGVGIVDNREIDRVNILNATKRAMCEAYSALKVKPTVLLVDAVRGLDVPCDTVPIVKGDATSYNIAAASIIAKVTRDRIMRDYDGMFPAYGFLRNKGYGTREHTDALRAVGSCDIHRKTFIGHFVEGKDNGDEER